MPDRPPPRPDMVHALLQSVHLVESARAALYRRWAPHNTSFGSQAERCAERADAVARSLEHHGMPPETEWHTGHCDWAASVVGATPEEVPLGPALVHRLAEWTNVFAGPYLTSDVEGFRALGEGELILPVPPRLLEPDERRLDASARSTVPDGTLVAVLNDLHLGSEGAEELVRSAVAEINALDVSLVLIAGDITDDGEPEQFELAARVLGELRAPMRCVLGNHDVVSRSTLEASGHALFERAFGVPAVDHVEVAGGVQFALVDTTDPVVWPWPDFGIGSGEFRDDASGNMGGALRPGQADALAASLDTAMPTLLIGHHEAQPFLAFPPVQFGLRESDSAVLFDALSGHRVIGMLAGHTHRSALEHVGPRARPVPQLELPALKDWPFCYTLLGVSGSSAAPVVRAVVRQLADTDLVLARSASLLQLHHNYALGPTTTLDHTFTPV